MDTSPHLARAQWMSLLAQADPAELAAAMDAFAPPADSAWLRPAQTGLYMLRGRVGGTGPQFNFGEITVTRCSVQVGEHIGHAWVRGSQARHAELAALADALMQDPEQASRLRLQVIEPLRRSLDARRDAASRKAAASKVEFFTVVRVVVMLAAFADPVFDSQRTFRELLQAMARPAAPRRLPVLPPSPAPMTPAAMAILLTLCDATTSVWLQQPEEQAVRHLRFHAGLRLAENPQDADFALITDPASMPALECFGRGDLRYPDRSASLIVQVAGFRAEGSARFAGPGIRDTETLSVDGLSADFWPQRAALAAQLPLGIDLFFVAAQHVVGLPRTTRLLER